MPSYLVNGAKRALAGYKVSLLTRPLGRPAVAGCKSLQTNQRVGRHRGADLPASCTEASALTDLPGMPAEKVNENLLYTACSINWMTTGFL